MIWTPTTKLQSIFSNKTQIPLPVQSNVVYQIPCSHKDCSLCYRGETKRHVKTRVSEHKTKVNTRCTHNALACHYMETGHMPDWDNIKIIDRATNWYIRKIKEALHIQKDNESYNIRYGDTSSYMYH